jgi:hypothetical protein
LGNRAKLIGLIWGRYGTVGGMNREGWRVNRGVSGGLSGSVRRVGGECPGALGGCAAMVCGVVNHRTNGLRRYDVRGDKTAPGRTNFGTLLLIRHGADFRERIGNETIKS